MRAAITEGALLDLFLSASRDQAPRKIKEIQRIQDYRGGRSGQTLALEKGCQKGKIIADATMMARDMVNEPSNVLTPCLGRDMPATGPNTLEFKLEREEMQKLMGAGRCWCLARQPPAAAVYRLEL
jgi:leucyl aminopeptidase